jgi:hypothetical protein
LTLSLVTQIACCTVSSLSKEEENIKPVLIGSGIKRELVPEGDGKTSGVLGLEFPEEFVQQPDEHLEDTSPSRALWLPSNEDDRDAVPEEPPLDEPLRVEGAFPTLGRLPPRPSFPTLRLPGLGRGGDMVDGETVDAMLLLIRGDVLTDPSGCVTLELTSLHFIPPPTRFCGAAPPVSKAL